MESGRVARRQLCGAALLGDRTLARRPCYARGRRGQGAGAGFGSAPAVLPHADGWVRVAGNDIPLPRPGARRGCGGVGVGFRLRRNGGQHGGAADVDVCDNGNQHRDAHDDRERSADHQRVPELRARGGGDRDCPQGWGHPVRDELGHARGRRNGRRAARVGGRTGVGDTGRRDDADGTVRRRMVLPPGPLRRQGGRKVGLLPCVWWAALTPTCTQVFAQAFAPCGVRSMVVQTRPCSKHCSASSRAA